MKNRILCLALCVLAMLMLPLPAAADTGYSGEINPATGEPYGEDDAQNSGERVALSGTMYYDWTTHDYAYPIQGTLGEVHSNAADGMVMTTPASIRIGKEASVIVYHNGVEYTGSLESCTQPGEYVVSALAGGQNRRLMSFLLVGPTTNAIHNFVVPDGFYIRDAERDKESVYRDRYSVDMEEEGEYTIEYECTATHLVYKLVTAIDRTPPALTFSGKSDREGRIRSKLDFAGLETGDTIYLSRSGVAVEAELNGDGTGTIYDPGNYVMAVTDAAGNRTIYEFIILQYLNLQSWIFIVIVIAAIGALVVYVVLQRKRVKIG